MWHRILITLALVSFLSSPAVAGFDTGKEAYDRKDWRTAITELRPLAEAGDDRAMVLLGNMYNEGYGVLRSHKEALSLFKRAATQKSNPQAMVLIGAMYTSGVGTGSNLNTAMQWFRRAAQLGNQQGAFFYATILFQGNKRPTDDVQPDVYNSYKWYRIAAGETQSPKFQKAALQISGLIGSKKLTAEQVAKADKEVAEWKPADAKTLGPFPEEPQVTGSAPTDSLPSPKSPDKPPAPPDPSPQ